MALIGKAAMLLSFDIVQEQIAEHDDWHTHEHFPERLSIPGFLRGSRWVAQEGGPRYFVMYEVESLDILASPEYLERLNNPTPWTKKMMAHYRGMTRGLCDVAASSGVGLGQAVLLIRFKPGPGNDESLKQWMLEDLLPGLPSKPGLIGAHFFQGGMAAAMTNEQRIRGKDAPVDCALVVAGYDMQALDTLRSTGLGPQALEARGATGISAGIHQLAYTLTKADLWAGGQ